MGHPKTEEEIAIFSSFGNLKLMEGCVVKKDFDGTYMLHYLNAIETKVESISIIHTTNEKFIEKLRNLCVSEIKKNEQNPHIAQKYGWLLKYIDLVYDEVD